MKKLKYEKVGDILSKYSFLEVYLQDSNTPFMEIGVTDDKELCFKKYVTKATVELTIEHWEDILETAKGFLQEVIRDEEGFDSLMNSQFH